MCVAIPAQIVEVDAATGVGRSGVVLLGGDNRLSVDLTLVPEAVVGDYVIIHSGYAVSKMSALQAAEVATRLEAASDRQ